MNRKQLAKVIYVCISLLLVLVIVYSGLRILESAVFLHQGSSMQTTSKTIVRDGVKYYPRQDITTVLVMGVNQVGEVVPTPYNDGGAVDMITLFVFDEKTEECTILSLNRDMMVTMPALNEYGKEVGTYFGQLAFSHAYGDGMADSCENVRATVSNLLYGTQIDYYFSMNMDAIALLNDAVGGVTVTVEDDFSRIDSTLTKGEVTLFGQHAVNFVQARGNVGDELNLSRMRRHKEYMSNFVPILREKIEESAGFVVSTYEAVAPYIVTDCSAQVVSRLEEQYGGYAVGENLTVKGENVLGEKYYEFYADEKALDDLILDLFYAPKE